MVDIDLAEARKFAERQWYPHEPEYHAAAIVREYARRQAVEERLHAALAKKWEFHLVAYPHASPYVEVWRKGGRFSTTISATLQQALEDAVAFTEGP